MHHADIAIIGGGIVGLATAYRLTERHPGKTIVVLEKEAKLAEHQTGHNSGVIHSGIYYKPGSLKALNCRRGKTMMEQFCDEFGIPWDKCGKVVVAVQESEKPALQKIFDRGQANGVDCRMITLQELKELEPHAAGVAAMAVPETGIVNYRQVCEKIGELVRQRGGAVLNNAKVIEVDQQGDGIKLMTEAAGDVMAKFVINCGGLQSDRVAKLTGVAPPVKIVPFRGEYFELRPQARGLVKNLIYPTPDPAFPFLGVHFTRMITQDEHGYHVECGPNAVPSMGREVYSKLGLNMKDALDVVTYPGFWRMAMKHWKMGSGEIWRSVSKGAFVKALQRLLPAITAEDLEPAPPGIRAQAMAKDGSLLDDFSIVEAPRVVNVLNAPSPAATASLSIGDHIVDVLEKQFDVSPTAPANP